MTFLSFLRNLRQLFLLALTFFLCLTNAISKDEPEKLSSEKVNLALRRTVDKLLRMEGDSTSRIPAIEQISAAVWRVRLERQFSYEQLPFLLQSSLEMYNLSQTYHVALHRCADAVIDLGYHQFDYLQNRKVPCQGRDLPEICHYIEISFLTETASKSYWASKSVILFLGLGGLLGLWLLHRHNNLSAQISGAMDTGWLEFGNSRLHVASHILLCVGDQQSLTFRESKLLSLFVNNLDQLLERDFIVKHVWEDEGVLVGRSVDVFVSRLRKKLTADRTIALVAVHGVGYRLETGK